MIQIPSTGLSRADVVKLAFVYATLLIVTYLGFSASQAIGSTTLVLAGLGVIAYVFGLRHGVDADHIAAIDTTTRKLMQEGKRPFTVGMWFSLGHSTVVVALIVGLVTLSRFVTADLPLFQSAGSVIGAMVSGSFLWVMGLINVLVFFGVLKLFRSLKKGGISQEQLDKMMGQRGILNRLFRPLFRIIRKPWQIYPVGVLFGLGFDTASEVALIAISVGVGVSTSIPVQYILILPILFTCGMVTVDTTDGVLMTVAYGWAFINPLRKLYYNLTITVISVVAAWAVGTVELLQVLSSQLNLTGAFWVWLDALDFETLGYGMVGIFVGAWLASVIVWKVKRLDAVVSGGPEPSSPGL